MKCAHHKEAEADLLLTFEAWKQCASLKRSSKWVKGHQDDSHASSQLDELATLNFETDHVATAAYTMTELSGTQQYDQMVLLDVKWAIFANGVKMNSKQKRHHHTTMPQSRSRTKCQIKAQIV